MGLPHLPHARLAPRPTHVAYPSAALAIDGVFSRPPALCGGLARLESALLLAHPHLHFLPTWLTRPLELRIDVGEHRTKPMAGEFASIYDRIHTRGDRLYGIPSIPLNALGLEIRYREADGEFYVYVVDTVRGALAGYTVFNRLIELGRQADRYVRAPHSKYDPLYQRRGLATAIYRWGLDAGLCLVTGARQSEGAHALWQSLGHNYPRGYVELRDKRLRYLGREVELVVRDALHTRMLLLGRGWTLSRFATAAGMR